jgi:hypothetical protein
MKRPAENAVFRYHKASMDSGPNAGSTRARFSLGQQR